MKKIVRLKTKKGWDGIVEKYLNSLEKQKKSEERLRKQRETKPKDLAKEFAKLK